jgi:uncharacterized membrane protein YphA (DoxX/SURF4 family)
MRWRDHIALTLPTFLLRLTLALTFLWAGTSKLVGTTSVQGDNAARLANLGVAFIQDAPPEPETEPNSETDTPDSTVNPLPGIQQPDAEPPAADPQDQPAIDPSADPSTAPPTDPAGDPDPAPASDPSAQTPDPRNPVSFRNISMTASPAVASDYPDPVKIRRVYGITLLLDHAIAPTLTEDSQTPTPTMPSWLGSGRMPVYAAWATAITELAAGCFLLLGFLTRLSSLSLMVVMIVALWTTHIGPAALQSSDAILGFIPSAADPWDPSSYSILLWQVALIVMSLSVALLGAGPLSIDRMIFRPGRRDPYVSGESRPHPVKPAKAPKQSKHDHQPHPERGEFDRSPPPQNNPTP